MPPDAMIRPCPRVDERPQELEVRALQQAVARDRGHLERRRRRPPRASRSPRPPAGPRRPGASPRPARRRRGRRSTRPRARGRDAPRSSGRTRDRVSAAVPTVDPRRPGADGARHRDRGPESPAQLHARPPVHLRHDLGRACPAGAAPRPAPRRGRRRGARSRPAPRTATATAIGSASYATSRLKSPWRRRTTRPPRMSIAGSSSNTASGTGPPIVDTRSPQLLAY